MKSVKSPKGNDLPLVNLKGKDYLMVAYRIQWLNEDTAIGGFSIKTDLVSITDDQTVARAEVKLYDINGEPLRSATATKRETKADFNDHTEKAETAAVGRALAMLGYGTQFALADLEEGDRIVDTPLKGKTDAKTITIPVVGPFKYTTNGASGTEGHTTSETPTKSTHTASDSGDKSTGLLPKDNKNTAAATVIVQSATKDLIAEAFKVLESQKKISKEEFKIKYLSNRGLSAVPASALPEIYEQIKKDFFTNGKGA